MTTTDPHPIPTHDQETHDVARALAPALADVDGNPWEYEPPNDDRDWTATAYIACGNQRLAIRAGGWQNTGRVSIHGEQPTRPDRKSVSDYQYPQDCPKNPTMTATLTKTPHQLAKEVARRILPDYRHRLSCTLAIIEKTEQHADSTNARAEWAAEVSNGTARPRRDGDDLDAERTVQTGARETARVSAGYLRFDRLSFTLTDPVELARAERVLRALAE